MIILRSGSKDLLYDCYNHTWPG